jgi:predicted Zn-dependent protease
MFFKSLLLLFLPLLAGCTALNPPLENQVLTAQDRAISEREAAQVIDAEFVKQSLVYEDASQESYVKGIVDRITRASHNKNARFTVRLYKQKEPNAFSIGGQYIYVTSGLLQYVKQDKDQLAGILGHEMSHDFLGHLERKETVDVWKDLAVALVSGNGEKKTVQTAAGLTANIFTLKYSRAYEKEADIFGAVYAYRAGFDPQGMVRFFEDQSRRGIPSALNFLSTHPADPIRVRTVSLVKRFLKGELTLDQIATVDPKTSQTLASVVRLDAAQK